VILAAQALLQGLLQASQGYEILVATAVATIVATAMATAMATAVATTNVKHISRFVDARLWTDIWMTVLTEPRRLVT